MRKSRFRSYLDDGLFVLLIMAAAMASAAMEAAAVLGAFPARQGQLAAKAPAAGSTPRPVAQASAPAGGLAGWVLARLGR